MVAAEIHRKVDVAEFSFDFDTSLAAIDALPDGDICWSAPLTTCEDCDFIDVTAEIVAGTSPGGAILFFAGRNGATNLVGTDDVTLTDHGIQGTAGLVVTLLGSLGAPVGSIAAVDTSATVHTVNFKIWYPGPSCNLFIYNDTGVNLATGAHQVDGRGWLPEIQ